MSDDTEPTYDPTLFHLRPLTLHTEAILEQQAAEAVRRAAGINGAVGIAGAIPTMRIVNAQQESGFVIINRADFDPSIDVEYVDPPAE